jgi:hypothetical protein
MKKIILLGIMVTAFMFLNGCLPLAVTALSLNQIAQDNSRAQERAITIKIQKGVFFECYYLYEFEGSTPCGRASTTPGQKFIHITVKNIVPKSEADKVGMKVGDEVMIVNGKDVCERYSMSTLEQPLMSGDDKPVKITMRRGKDEYVTFLNPF